MQADASIFHNPFHRKAKPAPHIALTMDGEIKLVDGVEPSRIEEYIIAYQAMRDSLHKFRDDEKRGELEVAEIAAVQADLDAMAKIDDPEHDATLPGLEIQLAKDTEELVGLDDSLSELSYVSYHKPKPESQWAVDLRYVRQELLRRRAEENDPWYAKTDNAYRMAIDDQEDYLAGDTAISAERVQNDIWEARFDLHCIGTHLCDLQRQNEGN